MALALACPPSHALVALNDGRDRIYVTSSVSVAHDSNVFASADSAGDTVYSTTVSAEYSRRAGWIGVNGTLGLTSAKFATIDDQDFANPSLSLEFTKQSGRTTGSVTLDAARQSRADPAVNVRTESWNTNTELNVRYPISGAMTVAGSFGYSNLDYTGSSARVFSDLETYHASLDLFHIFTAERDLVGGYRFRHGISSRTVSFTDHAFTVGIVGRIIRGINGSIRTGYQVRVPHTNFGDGSFGSWTTSASASYAFSKRLNVAGTVAKDFATTAVESFVDSLSASLDFQYTYSSRWSLGLGASAGETEFLGEAGRIVISLGPPLELGPARQDTFVTSHATLNYTMNEHLRVSVAYNWFKNWSKASFADFTRESYSLNLSTRW